MAYKVIFHFFDRQDTFQTKDGVELYEYNVGDAYPREGAPEPSAERISELAGPDNAIGQPLIGKVDVKGATGEKTRRTRKRKKVDIKELTVKQLTELAKEKGIKLPSKAKKAEIIKLIEEN